MTITSKKTENGTEIEADDRVFCILTSQTNYNLIQKFIGICENHDIELSNLTEAVFDRRNWNFNNPGQGKDWPIFKRHERLVTKLLKQTGIRDT